MFDVAVTSSRRKDKKNYFKLEGSAAKEVHLSDSAFADFNAGWRDAVLCGRTLARRI
ncbi:hypothetical protein [Sulfitobacter sp. JB4-11]|uniref:hypothetical protein n=1 Tax=Sulfitobacter rhodophyticola TaxID=3238304 RepID=UPI003510F942